MPTVLSRRFALTDVRKPDGATKKIVAGAVAAVALAGAGHARADGILVTRAAPAPAACDWTGFYAGGHIGYAWGSSNFTEGATGAPAAAVSGALNMAQPIDTFDEAGSFFAGFQGGYNHVFANRLLLGVEADATFPSFPDLSGLTIGGIQNFTSPVNGSETYSENVLSSGTVRGRIGYAPGHWLFYATGGFAWSHDQLSLTQNATGTTETPFLWRLGWAAGAGVEVPVIARWTARLEYLYTGYGSSSVSFPGERLTSDLGLQEFRLGLNYQFGTDPFAGTSEAPLVFKAQAATVLDNINIHGQSTFVWQGYPAIRSPYEGANSLSAAGEGRETFDATLSVGVRLWQGAELWLNPEVDQGFGFNNTHGVAGFTSAEAYKLGSDYPYARVQRYFVRQTIDLGGETQKVDSDITTFAGVQTANRLVLWVGRFSAVDVFDTNKYANNPKSDFLNWSVINAGTFDYAGDGWGYSYGAAAEWYQGRFTLRAGLFDLSATPAGGAGNAAASGLDPTFNNFQMIGEIEERHELWGEPGKLKITGFLSRGDAGNFNNALALAGATGLAASDALAAVRSYTSRPGVSANLEQQITETIGLFARAGWADGSVEPWDFTDIDRTVELGASFNGKTWGRPDDTVGVAGVVNGLASAHLAYFKAGGLGILIGDGQLPNYEPEEILETYYSYALSSATKVSFDYQFIANPAYNADRGPANVFAGRFHTQF
jgi:high affinity Mn2+ porin